VRSVTVDGELATDGAIALRDDGTTHAVVVMLGSG
jgi:hypothetical protein